MKLLKEMYGELNAWGRFWLYLGLATLFAAAAMSMDFGYSVSLKHAIFLGCLTFVTAFAPDVAYQQWKNGAKGVSALIAVCCVPLFAIEFYSHAGYTAGLRGQNVSEAHIQQTKWTDSRGQVEDNAANLKMWKAQLAKLQDENGWSASIKADGLRAELETAAEAIRQEEARGGCGPRCMSRMKQRDAIAEKLGVVEKQADLTARIEATQRMVDKYRTDSANVEYKTSSVDFQNAFLAKAVALVTQGSLQPTELQGATAEQTVNVGMAFAATGLPSLAFLILGLHRLPGQRRPEKFQSRAISLGAPEYAPLEPAKEKTTIVNITDRSVAQMIKDAIDSQKAQFAPA